MAREADDLVIDGVRQICPTPSQLLVGDLGAYCSRFPLRLPRLLPRCGNPVQVGMDLEPLRVGEMPAADIKRLSNYRRVPMRVRAHAIINPAFSLFCLSP
jgi:hypothetical protein